MVCLPTSVSALQIYAFPPSSASICAPSGLQRLNVLNCVAFGSVVYPIRGALTAKAEAFKPGGLASGRWRLMIPTGVEMSDRLSSEKLALSSGSTANAALIRGSRCERACRVVSIP